MSNPSETPASLSRLDKHDCEPHPEQPFEAPWQAQAFAILAALRRTGRLRPSDWAVAFGREIQSDASPGNNRDAFYFDDLLTTLEQVVIQLEMTDAKSLERYRLGWERAYRRTPHGEPVVLQAEDVAGS